MNDQHLYVINKLAKLAEKAEKKGIPFDVFAEAVDEFHTMTLVAPVMQQLTGGEDG